MSPSGIGKQNPVGSKWFQPAPRIRSKETLIGETTCAPQTFRDSHPIGRIPWVSRSAALVGLPFQQLMAFTPPNFTAWIAYDSSGYFTFGSDPKRSTCPSGSSILISYAVCCLNKYYRN